jgi:hypothetical protein
MAYTLPHYTRVVVAGSNSIYTGGNDVPPTFTQLTASIGQVDTSDQYMTFEGFQKAFVVNGANLKVVDMINTMLTHTELTAAHLHGATLTQAVTNAQMVVDFTDTAKTHTYGFVTSGTFTATANNITGSGSGTTFQATAVTPRPHWYTWTPYPGGTFGSLPSKAYVGCLYRGRCVLAGNPEQPQQWYMSRTANPWDWAYVANDAMSPVAGQDATVGKLGDMIKALIPYRDEYLIFGCANSIWVLRGDAAEGGSLQALDESKGIFGPKSWCFDHEGNLYFMSLTGLYMVPVGLGPIQDISLIVLPRLDIDEALDPAIHRITLSFDKESHGILICITKVSDGTNSNYWYDLKTNGFFPETYPTVAGVYSSFFYDATDSTNRRQLIGCKDGFIRCFDSATKSDATTTSTQAIESDLLLPILQSQDDNMDVKLTSLTVSVAGGLPTGTGGGTSQSDSDSVTVNYFAGKNTEAVLEEVVDEDTPMISDTVSLSTYPKLEKLRNRVKAHSIGIQLANSTINKSWTIEKCAAVCEDCRRS